ncbi:MAG: hypothetical protein ACRDKE_06550 [Solirubrobacterales bacterium]
MSGELNVAAMIVAFIVLAAVIFFCLSAILKRLDDRHERRSTEFRRKNPG